MSNVQILIPRPKRQTNAISISMSQCLTTNSSSSLGDYVYKILFDLYFVIYLVDRDNAVRHTYRFSADVMHLEFTVCANSQLQSMVGLFYNI